MTYAVQGFIEEKLGSKFVDSSSVEFSKSFEESGAAPHNLLLFYFLTMTSFQSFIIVISRNYDSFGSIQLHYVYFLFSGPSTPIFFILSLGVNPLKDVEALGRKLGYTTENKKFHNVSLGQGQEIVAETAMGVAAKSLYSSNK